METLDQISAVIREELPTECQNCERSHFLIEGLARQAVRFEISAENMAEWCCQIITKDICQKQREQNLPNN